MGTTGTERKTVKDTLTVISDAITENSTLTDALLFRGFCGRIIIDTNPKAKIKSIKFEYTVNIN